MINLKKVKNEQKSIIAKHAASINLNLLIIFLFLVSAAVLVLSSNIYEDTSTSLAYSNSSKAAETFRSFINKDLTLVRKVSRSKAVTGWFADETNEIKKYEAFDEMMDYIDLLHSAELYFVIHESLNEYTVKSEDTFFNYSPANVIDPDDPYNSWYYECIESKNDYTLNVDIDKFTGQKRLWINHKVIKNGAIAGVFCSGLNFDELYKKMFEKYNSQNMRGYIIDKEGNILIDSLTPGYSGGQSIAGFNNETRDPEFTSALNSFLKGIDGLFTSQEEMFIIKLSGRKYKYASVMPLSDTDWSVIILINNNILSGIINFIPLFVTMVVAFFVYVVGRNTMTNRVILSPLNSLTRSVSEGKLSDEEIYGINRNDEIGELARALQKAVRERQRQEQILHAVNSAAAVLLAAEEEENIHASLLKGMEIIGLCVDVDRIHIWRSEVIDGAYCYINQIQWLNESRHWKKPVPEKRAYREIPEWEENFIKNNYINGPISLLSEQAQDILNLQGVKAILAIPVYIQNQFWGYFSFDDCHNERTFTENEAEILRSAGLMIINAMNRNADLREQKRMMDEIAQRDNLLYISQRAVSILLTATDEEMFGVSILEGMELLGDSVDVDRIRIWQNEKKDDGFYYIKKFEWANTIGSAGAHVPQNAAFLHSKNPEFEITLSQGKCLNGPIKNMSQNTEEFLYSFGIKSVLIIPVHMQDKFWGFVSFEDCHDERCFSEDEVNILHSVSLMMVSALIRSTQAVQLRQAHEYTQILLDATPLAIQLWDKNDKMIDCNEENKKLFKVADKKEFIENFIRFSPEYQDDGLLSSEKADMIRREAFDKGRLLLEWKHMAGDGTLIPAEVTLVRVNLENEEFIASYSRDLREYKQMIKEIEQRDYLLNIVNNIAGILLQSESGNFTKNLQRCMKMLADAVGVQRVSIWKNLNFNNDLYFSMVYEWMDDKNKLIDDTYKLNIRYRDKVPAWEETLLKGDCINNLIRDRPLNEQDYLLSYGLKALFVMPVFVQDKFWGFVGYDDYLNERVFTENEQIILRSGGMVIANALLRNEITRNLRDSAAKLEAVLKNYMGIIWCTDENNTVTLFNGQYLNRFGFTPSSLEGKKLDVVLKEYLHLDIPEAGQNYNEKDLYDWQAEINGKVYRMRTTPIYGEGGAIINTVGSIDDVTERAQLQKDLAAALKEAQEANQAKSSFLANMSHEMRTPLNAIIGLSDTALNSSSLNDEYFENLEKINHAGMTLLSTVNDILDISKIEAGKFELVPVEYEIPSLINDTISQSIMRIGEKPIKFNLKIDENLPARLFGDDLRVKQILNNLLSNAFKYTIEGSVELGFKSEREQSEEDKVWLTAWVRDTGIGIKKEDLDSLFTEYAQMDATVNRRIEGTGLGLSITKRVVEMMNGSINVESEYGKGSIFTIRFMQKFVNDEVIGKAVADSLSNFHYTDQKRRFNSCLLRIKLPYARVLIVDDVPTNHDVARGMMKPYGMQIDCVMSGQEAINAIREEKVKYNAIFMDHMMPGMNGIEATRIIREEIGTEYAKTVPIIALTANAIVRNEEMFLNSGFQAFISKPINVDRLDAVIREWVQDKELEKTMEKVNIAGDMVPDIRSGKDRRTHSDRRAGTERQLQLRRIDGIDISKGLERFNHDEESFINVLRSYAVNTRPLIEKIKKIDKDNLADYAITVHGIKGSSKGICAEQIGTEAEALEEAAKEGNIDYVLENNRAFTDAAEKLLDHLDEILLIMVQETSKPEKDKPSGELLAKMLSACRDYDMDKVDTVMEEIEKYEYKSDDGLAAWLRENVDQTNFTQIINKLSVITG